MVSSKIRPPRKSALRAWRRAMREGRHPVDFIYKVVPKPMRDGTPHDMLGSAIFGWPDDDTLAEWAEAQAYRARVREHLKRALTRWIWTEIVQALRDPSRIKEGRLVYRSDPGTWTENTPDRLGRLWARERRVFGRRARRSVEAALSQTLFGQRILRAARIDDATYIASMYARTDDSTPFFQGTDGGWYSPQAAAEMIASARPWTRAEIVAQWRRHAQIDATARDFLARVEALVGVGGLGLPLIKPATATMLSAMESALPLVVRWTAMRLGIPEPETKPRLRPVDASDVMRCGRHDLLGAHDEARGDIALSATADRATLVHEVVHWLLSVSGERARRGLTWEAEERLAEQISQQYISVIRKNW